MSRPEIAAAEALVKLKINFFYQYKLNNPTGRDYVYDFYFEKDDASYIMEIDGEYHFRNSDGNYRAPISDYSRVHIRDIAKTRAVINSNQHMIRIVALTKKYDVDYMVYHIQKAIKSSSNIYYSDTNMYKHLHVTHISPCLLI